jgi:putative transposase
MPQSIAQIYLHLVFSTKDRSRFLIDADLRRRAHAYLAGTCNNQNCPAIEVGRVEDHVHVLCRLGKSGSVAELVRELKRESSKWIKEQAPNLAQFYWQSGYGAFSISPADVPRVQQYIRRQEEHHRTISFQDEFRRICQKYGVALDELYAWD